MKAKANGGLVAKGDKAMRYPNGNIRAYPFFISFATLCLPN